VVGTEKYLLRHTNYFTLVPVTEERDISAFAGAVMGLVNVIRRGQGRAFDVELVGIMELLLRRGPLSPGEIAAELNAKPSSVTGRVKSLREAGRVVIRPDPADGRRYTVGLSEAGEQEIDRMVDNGLRLFAAWTAAWTDQEISTFTHLAQRLVGTSGPEPTRAKTDRRDQWWKYQANNDATNGGTS
jgi:DNA-binding MarR family transcriptional regulator